MKTYAVSTRLRTLLPAVVLGATALLAASSWTMARADAPLQPNESSKPASAPKAPEVGDFSLLDQKGRFHQLRRVDGARAVVLMIAGNGCPVVRQNATKFKALRDKFPQVEFWMLDANPQDDRASILEESNEFEFGVPVLEDETQMVASSLGVKRTAEIVAISAKDWTVFYRGGLDDQMVQGAVRAAVREPYLENALRAFLDGKEVAPATTVAAGCLVHYDFASSEPVSYARQVAPILESKCVSCHSAGNIGPFAMSSYAKVKGFSDQIREEILTQRMPPWSADRHYGVFQGDRSLAPAEAQTLLRWIDAGAPRGEGEDGLAALAQTQSKPDAWVLGRPDYVVTPSHRMEIPATGVVEYITNIVDCPVPTDAWLKGAVVRPDNKKVLHHLVVYLDYPEGYPGGDRWEEKWLIAWVPGAIPSFFPEGTGKFVPKGTKIRFQLHYTPYGKEATDLSEVGLYLHRQPPAAALRMTAVANRDFSIPPKVSNHSTMGVLDFAKDTILYDLSPHMHKRGSWFRYEALYPDGKYEVLLSVPRYNFNWQHSYRFAQPKHIPAGTRILCTGGFDNSTSNPDNPDPTQTVHWGDQSFEEMFIGFMTASDSVPRVGVGSQHARVMENARLHHQTP